MQSSSTSRPGWETASKSQCSASMSSQRSTVYSSEESGTARVQHHFGSKPTSTSSSRRGSASSISSSGSWYKYIPGDASDPCSCSTARVLLFPVELCFFLYTFSLFLFIQLYQQYYFQQIAKEILQNSTNQSSDNLSVCLYQEYIVNLTSNGTYQEIQHQTNQFSMYTQILYQMTSFIVTLFVGPLSDAIGRKLFIFLMVCGLLLAAVGQLVIVHFHFSIWFFMVAAFILSLPGGFGGMLTMCAASIRDSTSDRWLTLRIGLLEASAFFAKALGSAAALTWIQGTACNFSPPAWMMMGAAVFCIVYVLLVPESLDKSGFLRMPSVCYRVSSRLLNGVKIFLWPPYVGFNSFWKILVAEIVVCVAVFNLEGLLEIQNYFLLNLPLEWSYSLVGIYGAVNSAAHGMILVLVLPVLTIVHLPDPLIALVGMLFALATSIAIAIIQNTWEMFLVGTLQGVQGLVIPVMRSTMGKLVNGDDHGALYSVSAAVQVAISVLATVLFNEVYHPDDTHSDKPFGAGLSFWIMAAMWTTTFPLLLCLQLCRRNRSPTSTLIRSGSVSSESTSEVNISVYGSVSIQ